MIREQALQVIPVVADLDMQHWLARRASDVVLEILSEALALPERARADAIARPLDTLGNEGVADAERRGEVLDQRIEEFAAGHGGRPLDDRAERLLGLAAVAGFRTDLAVEGGDGLVRLHV